MKSGVYRIVNTASGRAYIGKTTNLPVRLATHRRLLRTGQHHCGALQADWDAVGEAGFEFSVHTRACAESLGDIECALIAEAQAAGLAYNVNISPADGRPPLPADERLIGRSIRLKPADWEFIKSIGWARFRELIDAA